MQITIPKKLADILGLKLVEPVETDPLFRWALSWTNVYEGRKEDLLFLTHVESFFVASIYGIKSPALKRLSGIGKGERKPKKGQPQSTEEALQTMLKDAIRSALTDLGVSADNIQAYLDEAGDFIFTANHDRSLAARLNHYAFRVSWAAGDVLEDPYLSENTPRTLFCQHVNDHLVGDFSHDAPSLFFPSLLAERYHFPVYNHRVFEMEAVLDLGVHRAVRKLVVPASISFARLHMALQRAFSWENYHLYQFALIERNASKKEGEPIRCVVESGNSQEEDDFLTFENIIAEEAVLSDLLQQGDTMIYTYDFGDNWEHGIRVTKDIPDYDQPAPFLLFAEGNTPPEDCGGEGGFMEAWEERENDHLLRFPYDSWLQLWKPELGPAWSKPRKI